MSPPGPLRYKEEEAARLGMAGGGAIHGASRNPLTGLLFKLPGHSTLREAVDADRALGFLASIYGSGMGSFQRDDPRLRAGSVSAPRDRDISGALFESDTQRAIQRGLAPRTAAARDQRNTQEAETALLRAGMPLDMKVREILKANKSKNFVQRILNPKKFPFIKNKDGSISTHLMAAETVGPPGKERHIVFPTIVQDKKKKLERLDLRQAVSHAMQTGEFIEFPTLRDAIEFSIHYKKGAGQ